MGQRETDRQTDRRITALLSASGRHTAGNITTTAAVTTNQCNERLNDSEVIVRRERQRAWQTVQDGTQLHRAEHLHRLWRRRPAG